MSRHVQTLPKLVQSFKIPQPPTSTVRSQDFPTEGGDPPAWPAWPAPRPSVGVKPGALGACTDFEHQGTRCFQWKNVEISLDSSQNFQMMLICFYMFLVILDKFNVIFTNWRRVSMSKIEIWASKLVIWVLKMGMTFELTTKWWSMY